MTAFATARDLLDDRISSLVDVAAFLVDEARALDLGAAERLGDLEILLSGIIGQIGGPAPIDVRGKIELAEALLNVGATVSVLVNGMMSAAQRQKASAAQNARRRTGAAGDVEIARLAAAWREKPGRREKSDEATAGAIFDDVNDWRSKKGQRPYSSPDGVAARLRGMKKRPGSTADAARVPTISQSSDDFPTDDQSSEEKNFQI